MAQDFERYIQRNVGTSPVTVHTSNSDDAIISVRCANTTTSTISIDVYINDEKVARVKSLASYLNFASVEISDILKNYVEDNFNHLTPRPSPDEDRQTNTQLYIVNSNYLEMKSVKILAGEEYKVNGALIIFDGFDSIGEPAVYVSSWYSSYHAMDANSEEVLRAAGDLSNVQFSSNHLDVLERINKGMMNTAGYDGGSNYYETKNSNQ